ncbi:MAG: D-tyrosyl-tRNA(Tyr) deacylase [Gemmatimonas sp.]|nr:D-tyrosyl-tRNA(Tyr) deacylase [Gemmatimonas sp.]
MRAILQRVGRASVTVGDRVVGEIGHGLLVLVAFTDGDGQAEVDWLTEKVATLRIFSDDAGKMNLSLEQIGGSVLVVSQFTLYGDARKGRRPSFIGAASPDIAIPLYDALLEALRARGCQVAAGEFGAMMQVELVNDGPVTLILER